MHILYRSMHYLFSHTFMFTTDIAGTPKLLCNNTDFAGLRYTTYAAKLIT